MVWGHRRCVIAGPLRRDAACCVSYDSVVPCGNGMVPCGYGGHPGGVSVQVVSCSSASSFDGTNGTPITGFSAGMPSPKGDAGSRVEGEGAARCAPTTWVVCAA